MRRSVQILLVAGALISAAPARAGVAERILVMPFENVTRDNRIFWLSEGSALLLADDLNALGTDAITREERRVAFERLQVPPVALLTDATVIRIGQLVGATKVVVGRVQLTDDGLSVRARTIALEPGRIVNDATEHGAIGDLFMIVERLAHDLVPGPAASGKLPTESGSVVAFENYIKGLLAATPETAANYLNAALKLQPSFDRARIALWDVFEDQGDARRALAAVSEVRDGSTWSRHARFRGGLSCLELNKFDEAFATFKALADAQPGADVLNNLGIVQLRRGSFAQMMEAAYYFKRAADLDPSEPDYFFNLGYAYWNARDFQAAMYWLREAVRRRPTDGEAHFVLGVALATAGHPTEAAREKELARRLSSTFQGWEKRPGAEQVPKGLERIKNDTELPHAGGLEGMLTASGQRDQEELAKYYLDAGRRMYEKQQDRDALAELNRALFLSPYQAEAHLLVGRIHLRAGQISEAIDALKISLWSAETPDAHVALAQAYLEQRDTASAETEARRALGLDPSSAAAKQLLARLGERWN